MGNKRSAIAADYTETKRDDGPITGINFFDRWGAFRKLGADSFVIRGLDGEKGAFRTKLLATEPQWLAWRAWFFGRGMVKMIHAMDSHGLVTVPAEYPELFDKDAPVSDPFARLPRKSLVDETSMRSRLSNLFGGLTGEVGAWPADHRPRQPSGAQAKADAIQMLAERREEWASPMELSPGALKFAKFSDDDEPQF